MRIFVIDRERRDWAKKEHPNMIERRSSKDTTRRYLFIVSEPSLEKVVKEGCLSGSSRIYPHESGDEYIFYCVAKDINEDKFVTELFKKLKQNAPQTADLSDLEIHLCKAQEKSVVPFCYRFQNNQIVRSVL